MEILATNDGLRNLEYLRNLTQYVIKRSEMAVIEHAFFLCLLLLNIGTVFHQYAMS